MPSPFEEEEVVVKRVAEQLTESINFNQLLSYRHPQIDLRCLLLNIESGGALFVRTVTGRSNYYSRSYCYRTITDISGIVEP